MPDRLRAVTNKSNNYTNEGGKKKTKKNKKKAEAKLARQASGDYDDEEFEIECFSLRNCCFCCFYIIFTCTNEDSSIFSKLN